MSDDKINLEAAAYERWHAIAHEYGLVVGIHHREDALFPYRVALGNNRDTFSANVTLEFLIDVDETVVHATCRQAVEELHTD